MRRLLEIKPIDWLKDFQKKAASMHNIDEVTALAAQLEAINEEA